MRIVSFNVNGLKSMHGKSKTGQKGCLPEQNVLTTLIAEQNPDVLCLQETRCSQKEFEYYKQYYPYIYTNFAEKKGYSGTAILSRVEPIKVTNYVHNDSPIHKEGRMIVAEYEEYVLVNVYTPNSKDELARLGERLEWDTMFRNYITALEKPVVAVGDFNCASEDIDIHNPKVHHKAAGFSDDERVSFKKLALIDSFRYLHREVVKYSYWSNFHQARSKNRGWRIDYLLCSPVVKVLAADVLTEYFGSDHCPVMADFAY